MTGIMLPVFTVFNALPFEIRQLIWHLALPDDEPEVLVLQPAHIDRPGQDAPLEPKTVDTAFPTLMHTCHESREYVRNHSGIRFRSPHEAGCEVPFRPFRPDLDTVFWDEERHNHLWGPHYAADHVSWLSQIRHLAIPSANTYVGQHMTTCINSHCPMLQSLSVVFADSTNYNRLGRRFVEPGRRRKLRHIELDHAKRMKFVFDPWHSDLHHQITLYEFLRIFCDQLNEHGGDTGEPPKDCGGWRIQRESPGRCLLITQTFVQWRRGEWVEMRARSNLAQT
ncbi:uncharacterized protein B0H64DRAFT_395670 [Chaetomium fimeti]|uniref:2EXR domain-containing protein n=1 Tax=Chaetomium fimeti TaxID=1854472 RepID=A0AAE0HFW6_9PEZI|nr:hypothetical protein B0H64DRAFT_395670 [Chaetomium fimeti]